MKKYVILLAGGKGTRMNASVNKILLPLCGETVLIRSIRAFIPFADLIVIVSRPDEQAEILHEIKKQKLSFPFQIAPGGNTRQESVLSGVSSISPHPDDILLIHDAARCLVDSDLIERVIQSVILYKTGIPGIPATSTYKICNADSYVVSTPDRFSLYEIQTPQGFTAGAYIPYAINAGKDKLDFTDDAGLLEYYHVPVRVVAGSANNIKLTNPEDMKRARTLIEGDVQLIRTGIGYDVHRFSENRKLILCGVEIPFEFGLLGHSDADVALHALMDAMLGACALGDIGKHFPDTDSEYKGISSVLLLEKTNQLIKKTGFQIGNADITIVAQKPKLSSYIQKMNEKIAETLNIPVSMVNVKATTTEKLGFEGRMEGISAYAVCSAYKI